MLTLIMVTIFTNNSYREVYLHKRVSVAHKYFRILNIFIIRFRREPISQFPLNTYKNHIKIIIHSTIMSNSILIQIEKYNLNRQTPNKKIKKKELTRHRMSISMNVPLPF